MRTAIKGLAITLGLAEYVPAHQLAPADPEPAGTISEWLAPTLPGTFTEEMAAYRATAAAAAPEVAHEEDHRAARPRLVPLEAIRGAFRSRMGYWLDCEWRAWRELLSTYPDPEEGR